MLKSDPKKKVEASNLKSIKRIDPFAEEIVADCPSTALFNFNEKEKKWVKSEVEGPLFVYRRRDQPFFSFMIANRLSLDDHIEPISTGVKLKYEPPYIFIYKKEGKIMGLWFPGEDECKRIYNLFTLLRKNQSKLHLPEVVALIKSESNGDATPSSGAEEVSTPEEGAQENIQELPPGNIQPNAGGVKTEVYDELNVGGMEEKSPSTSPTPATGGSDARTTPKVAAAQPMFSSTAAMMDDGGLSGHETLVGLSRDQLLQGIIYLLKHDASFLDKIHEGYCESLKHMRR